MNTYTTVQGDCWDLVAFKLYGSEAEANMPLLDYLTVPPGTVINVPDVPEDYDTEDTVFWRQEASEEPYSSVEEDGDE